MAVIHFAPRHRSAPKQGEKLITGEADVLKHGDTYFLYFNNWGPCPGVDCCNSTAGCASCCFVNPPTPYVKGCGNGPGAKGDMSTLRNSSNPYGLYHTVQVYSTKDFTAFQNLGVALRATLVSSWPRESGLAA